MDFGSLRREWQLGDGKKLSDGLHLGQYIGKYIQFEAHSHSSDRQPTYSVLAECIGDITDDVTHAEYSRRKEDSLAEPNYGTGQITIFDEKGKYIENGRPKFIRGKRVYIFGGFDGDNIPRFGGLVRDIYVDSTARNIQLTLAEDGYALRTAKTSGDYSSYDSPKLLVNQVASLANIADPIYENETGRPTNFTFGHTYLGLRSLWSMVHGSALCIGYKQMFNEAGRLTLKRSTSFEDIHVGDTREWQLGDGKKLGDGLYLGQQIRPDRPYEYFDDYIFDDKRIQWLVRRQMAALINKKTVDFVHTVKPEFTAGDGIRAGQHTKSRTESLSKHKYGEYENQETDELIGTWSNAGNLIDQSLDEYPFPRGIYEMRIKALPQLQIDDRIFVNSEQRNIQGWFHIIGIHETISPGRFNDVFTLLSEGERF